MSQFSVLSSEKQAKLIAASVKLHHIFEHIENAALIFKLGGGVAATNITEEGLLAITNQTAPDDLAGYFAPLFLLIQQTAILAGVPVFYAVDFAAVFIHNMVVDHYRKKYTVDDEMIETANGKLDGFKKRGYGELACFVTKFLTIAVTGFTAFTILLNLIKLLNSFITELVLNTATALLVPVGIAMAVKFFNIPLRDIILFCLAAAFVALGVDTAVLHHAPNAPLWFDTFSGPTAAAVVPGPLLAAHSIGLELRRDQMVELIKSGQRTFKDVIDWGTQVWFSLPKVEDEEKRVLLAPEKPVDDKRNCCSILTQCASFFRSDYNVANKTYVPISNEEKALVSLPIN